jgi:hypothetical protein
MLSDIYRDSGNSQNCCYLYFLTEFLVLLWSPKVQYFLPRWYVITEISVLKLVMPEWQLAGLVLYMSKQIRNCLQEVIIV